MVKTVTRSIKNVGLGAAEHKCPASDRYERHRRMVARLKTH